MIFGCWCFACAAMGFDAVCLAWLPIIDLPVCYFVAVFVRPNMFVWLFLLFGGLVNAFGVVGLFRWF